MRISDLDKNFKVSDGQAPDTAVWLNAKDQPFKLFGVFYDEEMQRFTRMPHEVAEKVSFGVGVIAPFTPGGRVRFKTDSPYIGIKAVMKNEVPGPHMTLLGECGFDLYRTDETGHEVYLKSFMPPIGMTEGYSSLAELTKSYLEEDPGYYTGKVEQYTINFPLYDGVQQLYIALDKDSVIMEADGYRDIAPIVYYGSSITQGGCATRPGNSYQGIITRKYNIDHLNLGFSGNAKGEDLMVEYMAGLDMSVFVCDYDHNAPNLEFLKNTLPNVYNKIRAAKPDLPFIFISAPTPKSMPSLLPRREFIRGLYLDAVNKGDKNVYFIDGEELFEGECADACTVDGIHPNDLGFYRMAMRIAKEIEKAIDIS